MTSARREKATCDVSTAGERGVKQIEGTAEQRQSAKNIDFRCYTSLPKPYTCRCRGVEVCNLLLGSIMEVSSLLSIAIGRFAASISSGLGLLLSGAGHHSSASISFHAWPAIHHRGGHCQDWPGLVPGRSTPDRERGTANMYLWYVSGRCQDCI